MAMSFNQKKKALKMWWKLWKSGIVKWDDIPKKYQELIRKYYCW